MLGPGLGNGSFQKLNSKRSWFRLETNIFALSFRNSKYSYRKKKPIFYVRKLQTYTLEHTHLDKDAQLWSKILANNIQNVSKAFFTTPSPIHLSLKVSVVCPPPVYQTFNPLFYCHVPQISWHGPPTNFALQIQTQGDFAFAVYGPKH